MFDSLGLREFQHIRLLCSSLSPKISSDWCLLSWWCHPAISHSLSLPSPTLSLSQHQGLFHWVGSLHQVARVLELQHQHQSFSNEYSGLICLRIDWFDLLAVHRDSGIFSSTIISKHQFFGAQPSLWSNSTCSWYFPVIIFISVKLLVISLLSCLIIPVQVFLFFLVSLAKS